MKYLSIASCLLVLQLGFSSSTESAELYPDGQKKWTVEDSIRVRYLLAPGKSAFSGPGILWSPTARYFGFISRRGDLATDSNLYTLHVYETAAVRAWAAGGGQGEKPPSRRASIQDKSSSKETAGIRNLQWNANEDAVFFQAPGDNGRVQVFEFSLKTQRLRQRTRDSNDIESFAADGDAVVFATREVPEPPVQYPVQAAERIAIPKEHGHVLGAPVLSEFNMPRRAVSSVITGRQPARPVPGELLSAYGGAESRIWISPDGSKAIGTTGVDVLLIDLSSLHTTTLPVLMLFNSWPTMATPVWSPDSSHVVLVNARRHTAGAASSDTEGSILDYTVRTGELKTLDKMPETYVGCLNPPSSRRSRCAGRATTRVRWLNARELSVSSAHSNVVYAFGPSGPVRREVAAASPRDLEVEIRQSANEPPRVVASVDGREAVLTEPDPALQGLWLAEQKPFSWTENGETVTGGLYLPRNFERGRPVPLAVQQYIYLPQEFLPDGAFSTSFAAQLLAARGFAVLQYEMPLSAKPREGARAVARFDAAVGALAKAGIVDPARIGLLGFSRSSYQAFYIITHPGEIRVAAAVGADGFVGAYPNYLRYAATSGAIDGAFMLEGPIGAGSFWQNQDAWLEHDTLFNVHRVRTPYMFTLNGDGYFKQYDGYVPEVIGAFALNRRPVEYLYFPDGAHNLQRPLERKAMLEATVDWLSFWILGQEDPVASKAAQYERWRKMRDDWRNQQAWEAAGNPTGSMPARDFKSN